MILLGLDLGSSSVKASLLDAATGACLGSAFSPRTEMAITAVRPGWAEQEPSVWWKNLTAAVHGALSDAGIDGSDVGAIGIAYQMHGLVLVDRDQHVLRPAIIWCDSRAVEIGRRAFEQMGSTTCLEHLLNSPGNFTASKLRWVKENEPDLFKRIDKIMLPGDYVAMKLTDRVTTTVSGLSEGMFWDFSCNEIADIIMDHFGFEHSLIPERVPTFGNQGSLTRATADELGLKPSIPVTYRAGDQPNNAFSLNVLKPGEIAATAGTSGVVYGVSNEVTYDHQSRVNTFAHVNHAAADPRLGVLLCVNGTGILNSWLKKNVGGSLSYTEIDRLAALVPIGSDGLTVLPFGNGAERMLGNAEIGAQVSNLNFNIHTQAHLFRAAQEGIVFSFKYGMDIMGEIGITPTVIRAGHANMFRSATFRDTLAGVTGAAIELYDTDGAQGAARGAGVGTGYYNSCDEAFAGLETLELVEPNPGRRDAYAEAYQQWFQILHRATQTNA